MSQPNISLKEHCDDCDRSVDQIDGIGEARGGEIIISFTCPNCKVQWISFYEFFNREKLDA